MPIPRRGSPTLSVGPQPTPRLPYRRARRRTCPRTRRAARGRPEAAASSRRSPPERPPRAGGPRPRRGCSTTRVSSLASHPRPLTIARSPGPGPRRVRRQPALPAVAELQRHAEILLAEQPHHRLQLVLRRRADAELVALDRRLDLLQLPVLQELHDLTGRLGRNPLLDGDEAAHRAARRRLALAGPEVLPWGPSGEHVARA